MKNLLKIIITLGVFTLAVPLVSSFFIKDKHISLDGTQTVTVTAEITAQMSSAPAETTDVFTVLDITSGEVISLATKDYIIGAVMAEMPATYEMEALKAQAVAAYTYAVRKKLGQEISPSAELMGAYISNDSTKYQAFFTENQAKAFYGEAYEIYHSKVSDAVSEVYGEILLYENEPILAAFHSTSGGRTESAKEIWSEEIAYLQPVESPFDEKSPTFYSEIAFASEKVEKILQANLREDVEFPTDKKDWFFVSSRTNSGTVSAVSVCGEILNGAELRAIFELQSAYLEVKYNEENDEFVFSTKGHGHFVGLSQYGANKMAENGKNYKEILLHYYTGVTLEKNSF